MARRPVNSPPPLAQGEEIRNRDRLIMGDEPAVLRLGRRCPGPYPRARAGAQQIDRAIRSEGMPSCFRRHMFFMRSPAEFGGLETLRNKALDRPRIDENAARLRRRRALGIAFGEVDTFDACSLREP